MTPEERIAQLEQRVAALEAARYVSPTWPSGMPGFARCAWCGTLFNGYHTCPTFPSYPWWSTA